MESCSLCSCASQIIPCSHSSTMSQRPRLRSPHGRCDSGDCALFCAVSPHMKHGQAVLSQSRRALKRPSVPKHISQHKQLNRKADSLEPMQKIWTQWLRVIRRSTRPRWLPLGTCPGHYKCRSICLQNWRELGEIDPWRAEESTIVTPEVYITHSPLHFHGHVNKLLIYSI